MDTISMMHSFLANQCAKTGNAYIEDISCVISCDECYTYRILYSTLHGTQNTDELVK